MDINKKMKNFKYNDFLPTLTQILIGLGLGIVLMVLVGCEKEYSKGNNYVYTFSGLVVKDQWGIETWGAHQFVTDELIEDVESFKECYVNYLYWSGLDEDGMYKKIYYQDSKKIKIQYVGKTYARYTNKNVNNCQ